MSSANRLARSTSPYLLQHADNPVDWWPWCDEALALARSEDRPILLSIGYSACHWCHVMAHESFDDPATATLMNELFVNIKVDREERPDLDQIYQTAHQLLARRPGGWPLTAFLMPDGQMPFFIGTYFPPEKRHGLLAFRDLLTRVHGAFRGQRSAIDEQNQSLQQALQQLSPVAAETDTDFDDRPLVTARQQLSESFDKVNGGFGQAPKFPHPTGIEMLLHRWQHSGDELARHMAHFSLERMALGGINDQVGGGFCRYSVDEFWMIPHFEKMLYDNGQLLGIYAEAWLATDQILFQRTCERIAAWAQREMQDQNGGYYSSLDADSEGEEGRFYVWERDEVRALIGEDRYPLFAEMYGFDRAPNFENKWHLHCYTRSSELARRQDIGEAEMRDELDQDLAALFEARSERIRPACDDKILTSWNALMIKGMARVGRILGRQDWFDSAQRAIDYLRATHWVDGRLLATSRNGRAQLPAYLDDYAYLIDALLEMLRMRWSGADFDWALALAEGLLTDFQDPEHGGFFFTARDHEQLIQRPKPLSDDATPSGNGVAARVLERLGHLLGESRYLDAAARTMHFAWPAMQQGPYGHGSLLMALEEQLQPTATLVLRGEPDELEHWGGAINAIYAPHLVAFPIPNDATGLGGLLEARRPQGQTVAYYCVGTSCRPPIRDLEALCAVVRGA